MNISWTDAHDKALRVAINEGCTFAQAANVLADLFKVQYSRSAIGGRCSRLGIKGAKAPRGGRGKIKPVQRRALPAPSKPGPKPKPVSRMPAAPRIFASDPITGLRVADVVPRHISIYEMTDATCKWPFGDSAPYTYCGCQTLDGPYCEPHAELSCGRGTIGERKAHHRMATA